MFGNAQESPSRKTRQDTAAYLVNFYGHAPEKLFVDKIKPRKKRNSSKCTRAKGSEFLKNCKTLGEKSFSPKEKEIHKHRIRHHETNIVFTKTITAAWYASELLLSRNKAKTLSKNGQGLFDRNRRRLILPGGLPPSTISAEKLNYCVRYENR